MIWVIVPGREVWNVHMNWRSMRTFIRVTSSCWILKARCLLYTAFIVFWRRRARQLRDPDDVSRKCFYAYALLDGRSLEKCEAAMIKQFKPYINIKAKKSLGCHDESYFRVVGEYVWSPLAKGKVYHVVKD